MKTRMLPLAMGLAAFSATALSATGCASMKGRAAPDFQLSDLEGKAVKLSDFHGKPILLCFWAVG